MRSFTVHQIGRDYETLEPALVVEAGCQTFWFRSKEHLLDFIREYVRKPDEVEKAFYSRLAEMDPASRGLVEEVPVPTTGMVSSTLNQLRR